MKKLIVALLLLPHLAWAENLPSLTAVDNPKWQGENTIADDKFPEFLETQEDYTSAILEWRRVIYTTQNKHTQKRALASIARLYNKMNRHQKALTAYENYLATFPQVTGKNHILEQIHRLSILTGDHDKAEMARNQLFKLTESSENASEKLEQAELYMLWHQALLGADTFAETHSPKGQRLKEKLQAFPVNSHPSVQTATLLSLIPGLGYLYLGYINWAILVFLVNVSFFYALTYAMKHKHWGYGFAFGSFAAFVYVGSMFYASTVAAESAYLNRLSAMEQWHNLQPLHMDDFENISMPSFQLNLAPHSKL